MIDVSSGIDFATPAANDGDVRSFLCKPHCRRQPTLGEFAVAVDELNEFQVWVEFDEASPTGIAATGGGKWLPGDLR